MAMATGATKTHEIAPSIMARIKPVHFVPKWSIILIWRLHEPFLERKNKINDLQRDKIEK